jgi:nucleotide-binding universal stress UspA family protein
MFDTILVGLDGSPDSEQALPVAADLARRYDSVVVLCHVEERVVGKGGTVPIRAVEEIQAKIQAQADELNQQGITTKVEWAASILGGPASVLEQIADRLKTELIIVGRKGRSAIAGVLLGSVTDRLLHVSERHVLAAPPAKKPSAASRD